jgi:hypothetical protein
MTHNSQALDISIEIDADIRVEPKERISTVTEVFGECLDADLPKGVGVRVDIAVDVGIGNIDGDGEGWGSRHGSAKGCDNADEGQNHCEHDCLSLKDGGRRKRKVDPW